MAEARDVKKAPIPLSSRTCPEKAKALRRVLRRERRNSKRSEATYFTTSRRKYHPQSSD